jgi:hypothetical protein
MQKLIDNGISWCDIGAIARDPSARTPDHQFFDDLGIGARFPPFYECLRSRFRSMRSRAPRLWRDVRRLVGECDARPADLRIPDFATTWLTGGEVVTYDIGDNECVFIVNTNGDTYESRTL